MSTKRITLTAMLSALSLIIFIIEAQLPPIVPLPGIKLGLANIITLTALYTLGRRDALIVLAVRIGIGSIFTGSAVGILYSISGGLVSFIIMSAAMLFIGENRMWAVSVLGAIAHNIGQIAVALLLLRLREILWYLPVLIISAVITGTLTGITAQITLQRLKKYYNSNKR